MSPLLGRHWEIDWDLRVVLEMFNFARSKLGSNGGGVNKKLKDKGFKWKRTV